MFELIWSYLKLLVKCLCLVVKKSDGANFWEKFEPAITASKRKERKKIAWSKLIEFYQQSGSRSSGQ